MSVDVLPVEAFEFEAQQVRTTVIDGAPWFVAGDVANVLGYRMASDALRIVEDDEKGTQMVRTPGGTQMVRTINESGLYALILRSRRPEAKAFRRWVTGEVLPCIRRTGSYTASPAQALPTPRELAALVLAEADRADAAEAQVRELAPKAEAHDAFLTATDSLSFAEVARVVGYGRNNLFRRLRDLGILQANNLPYRQYDHHFEIVLGVHHDRHGVAHPHHTTRVRPSGVEFIRRKLATTAIEVAR